jgi:hypothetical protein
MPQYRHASGDIVTVSETLVGYMDAKPGWQRELTDEEKAAIEEEVAELKGADLNNELDKAGLPKTGLADEKRARLAEKKEN